MQAGNRENKSVNNTHRSFTPHELVQYHMEHPDEPITDADMRNLNLELDNPALVNEIVLTPAQKQSADELADAAQSNGTGMSYKADI